MTGASQANGLGSAKAPEPPSRLRASRAIPSAEFVPPPTADELPIVQRLEKEVCGATVGDVWQAAGVIKALYAALMEATPEVAAIAHCCHTLDQAEMWAVVHRADAALGYARRA